MRTSNTLFWMSCFPSMIMLSWMHNSMRQPGGAHCGGKKNTFLLKTQMHIYCTIIHTNQQQPLMCVTDTYLLHAIVSKDVNIISRPPNKPV